MKSPIYDKCATTALLLNFYSPTFACHVLDYNRPNPKLNFIPAKL